MLHLIRRRQPQKLPFPALQFIRSRQQANRRRMNLRHWLLLLLRCALVAGVAFALARPTLKGTGLQGKEGAPLAVALVLDNSLRMQYLQQNQTRLEEATETALGLVEKFPENSELAVIDLSRSVSGFVNDRSTARSRLRNLAAESHPRPLEDAVREAIQLLEQREDHRQELFLFSDLSTAAWTEAARSTIREAMEQSPEVQIYLVDVGVEQVRNAAIGPLELNTTTLRPGQSLHIEAPVQVVAFDEEPLVEVFLESDTGNPTKRGQQIAELDNQGQGQVSFELGDLPLGTHQGYVQLNASDPLRVDNTRYFTVEVRPPADVLLLGKDREDALFLREALSPSLLADRREAQFQTDTETYAQATELDFSNYQAVCLLDPPPLSDELWQSLVDYARSGGGVGMFLGERATSREFNQSPAQQLLPAPLKRKSRYATYLRPRQFSHPALVGLKNYEAQIPWQVYPVWKYWQLDDLSGDSYVIARFANGEPALVEKNLGRGRAITLVTPLSDPLQPAGREPWNLLPTGPEPWLFWALSNQLVGYLAQDSGQQRDFLAGETVSLRLSPRERVSGFVLHQPDSPSIRRVVPTGEDTIRISTTRELGNYRVAAGGTREGLDRGFSINPPPSVSALDRIDQQTLAETLPPDDVKVADNLDEVQRYVNIGRTGRELFPWAICLVALIWGSEHFLANRFYRGTS